MEGISASLPANYVSLKDLQDRWLKGKKEKEENAERRRHEEEKEAKTYRPRSKFQKSSRSFAANPVPRFYSREKTVKNITNGFNGRDSMAVGFNDGSVSIGGRSDVFPEVSQRQKAMMRRLSILKKRRKPKFIGEIKNERAENQCFHHRDKTEMTRMNEFNGKETMSIGLNNRSLSIGARSDIPPEVYRRRKPKKRRSSRFNKRKMPESTVEIKNERAEDHIVEEDRTEEICTRVANPSVRIRNEMPEKQRKGLVTVKGDRTEEIRKGATETDPPIDASNEKAEKHRKDLETTKGDWTDEIRSRVENLSITGGGYRHGGRNSQRGGFQQRRSSGTATVSTSRSCMMWVRKPVGD